jgi:EAL domain-containing protein (putative c-di-GMP-specific phosphodiesterase class I)
LGASGVLIPQTTAPEGPVSAARVAVWPWREAAKRASRTLRFAAPNGQDLALRSTRSRGTVQVNIGRDRLGRFFPVLLGLTLLASVLEGVGASLLHVQALGRASISTAVFAIAVLVAGYQVRAGRPVKARIVLAISLIAFGALGGLMIPGVGQATALLPVVSFILLLPHTSRGQLLTVSAATIGSTLLILVVDRAAGAPPDADLVLGLFRDAILVGVVILVLAGVADFAMESRDSLRELGDTTKRQLRVTTARLALVAALRRVRRLPTPEATAGSIATALADLPLVDFAVILEATDDGLSVLATAGVQANPIQVAQVMPASRAEYLLDRSRSGAWAQLWADRPGPGLDDDEMTEIGVEGQAFAPILADDEIVGLISIATTDRDQAEHLVADLPSVSEAAAVANAILAPMIVARRRLRTAEVRIAQTIASGAFQMVFQPIVDLDTGLTVGFEALTRFEGGDAPDKVFAEAAKVGLGPDLEAATLTAALRDAAGLPADAWLALNVSPTFLGESARLISILANRTRAITVEITEHEVIDDYGPIRAAMGALGPDIRLAVDDAGAGVANFRHLVELRPALVKIDAGLIRGVNADVARQAVVVGLVHFAEVSGAFVLAEGIETEAEQETVQRLGVTLGQGYRLGRPAAAETWSQYQIVAPSVRPVNIISIRKRAKRASRQSKGRLFHRRASS